MQVLKLVHNQVVLKVYAATIFYMCIVSFIKYANMYFEHWNTLIIVLYMAFIYLYFNAIKS